jgi:predicted transcriptional regulator
MDKSRVVEVVDALPDDVDLDALIEKLYLLKRLELAEEEVARGRVLEHEEVESRYASWLE